MSSIFRFRKQNSITPRIPETTTLARQKSSSNPRSAYAWYICLTAYANDKSAQHVINMDGTQIMVVEKKKRKADRTIEVQNAKARKIEDAIILVQKNQTV